jgi:hypothetical protein
MSSRRKSAASSRRELQVAAAVAREAVLELHAEGALSLIRHAEGRVSELRMLEIYVRILELPGPVAEAMANRVLAVLGRSQSVGIGHGMTGVNARQEGEPGRRTPVADADVVEDRSVFRTLRRRLRGRVHDELRRTVELQTGVARVALLDTHARHAHGFARLLAETHDIAAACGVYTEMVDVPRPLAAVLYIMVLDRIAAEEAPAWPASRSGAASALPQQPPLPRESRPPVRAGHRSHRTRSSA